MSCRQAAPPTEARSPSAKSAGIAAARGRPPAHAPVLRRNVGYPHWMKAAQELARCLQLELPVRRFDGQEELVAGRALELRHVEDRVIWHRQAVQRNHSDH